MSVFTEAELDYLRERRLARLATVGADGTPHVVPVGWRYDREHDAIEVGGHDLARVDVDEPAAADQQVGGRAAHADVGERAGGGGQRAGDRGGHPETLWPALDLNIS